MGVYIKPVKEKDPTVEEEKPSKNTSIVVVKTPEVEEEKPSYNFLELFLKQFILFRCSSFQLFAEFFQPYSFIYVFMNTMRFQLEDIENNYPEIYMEYAASVAKGENPNTSNNFFCSGVAVFSCSQSFFSPIRLSTFL